MTSFIINITNTSGETGTIVPDIGFEYTDYLNDQNKATIKISSIGSVRRGLVEIGSIVEIKKSTDGVTYTRAFYGLVTTRNVLEGGGLSITAIGYEIRLSQENGAYSSSPWTSTASATIAASLIGECTSTPPLTAGTINTGTTIDFRASESDSIWNALTNLVKKTGQDIQIDYDNLEVDVLDHRGVSTPVYTLNQDRDFDNLRVTEAYPTGNYVVVYGKSDGENQIKSTSAHGQDSTSQSTYGIIKRVVIDRSVLTVDEANILADAEVAITKNKTKIYDFTLSIIRDISAGDHIYMNSPDYDLSNEEVRVLGVERGIRNGKEYMNIEVGATTQKNAIRNRDLVLAQIQKQNRDNVTYKQGNSNTQTWSGAANAKNTIPLIIPFYVSPNLVNDEAGTLRVNSLTLDYDVDPYKINSGSASGTAASHNHSPLDNGHDHNNPQQTSSAYTGWSDIGDYNFSENVATSWDAIFSLTVSGTISILFLDLTVQEDSWSGTDTFGVQIEYDSVVMIQDINKTFNTTLSPFRMTYAIFLNETAVSKSLYVRMYSTGGYDYQGHLDIYSQAVTHTHTVPQHDVDDDNADVSSSNIAPALSVTIGDDVDDAASVNASQVSIYLDYWNGSSWVNKHSILNTGKTLDTDVDITNSGTYPDTTGTWRVRIITDSASADYLQGIVKLKHFLES